MRYFFILLTSAFPIFSYCEDLLQESLANCEKNQLAMNVCANYNFEKADKKLNNTYKKLYVRLTDSRNQSRLKIAQLQWIKFRDSNCGYVARGSREEGGSMFPMEYNICREKTTKERTTELEKFYKCTADDCPH